MSLQIIQERLDRYNCQTPLEEEQALKEITQEIILLALARRHFFDQAEFHGGTALRILYQLPRFSEDLDFALLKPDSSFQLTPYLREITEELSAFGYEFAINDRSQTDSAVRKAFLKENSIGKLLILKTNSLKKEIKIKLEVDTNPPLGASTEIKYLNFPSSFGIQVKDLPSSFAGKIHALLCRKYLKGRDWYDFIWYVARKIQPNLVLLKNALQQIGPWQNQDLTIDDNWFYQALKNKIEAIQWKQAAMDVAPFLNLQEQKELKLWNTTFFLAQLDQVVQQKNAPAK